MAEGYCEALSVIGLDYLHRKPKKLSDSTRWSVGAGRLCNAGNICFAFSLMAVSLVMVNESIRALASSSHELGKFEVAAVVAAVCGFGIKLSLAVYCFIFRRHSSQVQMLWEDNRNDCFEYGFTIFTAAAGAMLIASAIIVTWIGTVDTVCAYHWGEDSIVAVDIVMSPDCSLREAHDVSQELQDKLETVDGFARAFVHVDYGAAYAKAP